MLLGQQQIRIAEAFLRGVADRTGRQKVAAKRRARCSTMCRRDGGSSASVGRAMAVGPAGLSITRQHRSGRSPRGWPPWLRSPMFWSPNTAITCRSTGRARSSTTRRSRTDDLTMPSIRRHDRAQGSLHLCRTLGLFRHIIEFDGRNTYDSIGPHLTIVFKNERRLSVT
jgi:hypothetical protein